MIFCKRFLPSCLLLGLFFVFTHPCCAQPQRGGIPTPKQTIIPDKGVELKMMRYNRLPMIEAKINGKGPFRLVVDTGASGIVLRKKTAKDLKLPAPPGMPEGVPVRVRAPGSDGISATIHYVEGLTMGEAKFKGVWTIAMELPFGDGMDGVIGMDVFHDCLLTYDYPKQKIVLKRGALPAVNQRDVLAYSNPGSAKSYPRVEFKIDGKPKQFMIDTGMRGWFAVSKKTLGECDPIQGPVKGEMGLSAAGLMPVEVARVGNTFKAGSFAIQNPVVRIMSGSMADAVVGTFFLENFRLTFDAKNHRVQFTRESTEPITPPALRTLGFGLRQQEKNHAIWYVHAKSNAAKVGLKEKDIVLAVDGVPIEKIYGTNKWQKLIDSQDKVRVRYRSTDDDAVKTVELEVFEILPAAPKS